MLLHGHPDLAVSDRASNDSHSVVLKGLLEAEVAHHGGNDPASGEAPVVLQLAGPGEEDVIAVEHRTFLVHQKRPVGVSVEGEAAIRAALEDRFREASEEPSRRSRR